MKALFGFCLASEETLDAASAITNPRADFAALISQAINNELQLAANPAMRRELERAAIGEGPGALELAGVGRRGR
jgi:hypothetical protein